MATIDEARHVLRGLGREVIEVDDGSFGIVRGSDVFLVPKIEVDRYLSMKSGSLAQEETAIWVPGYYEHIVQFEGSRPRRPYQREETLLELESRSGTKVVISRPSIVFCLAKVDTDKISSELRRLLIPFRRSEPTLLSDMFRLYSIQVISDAESTIGANQKRAHEIADASIFHFAYGYGTPISFTKSWARTYYWIGRKSVETVQFPLKTYNSELVSYYNLAISSDSLVLGFLALYKILEYFYSSVAEEELHGKIKEKLTAPDFAHTKTKKLRELVRAISVFESRTDELSSLKLVIAKYFDKRDLRDWIENYEKENGVYFTVDQSIFSGTFRIDTSDQTLIPNLCNRIYAIRNAIVHNKEAEVSRYVPYSGQEETLHKELQLLVFLAEQLIIKTGKDIAS